MGTAAAKEAEHHQIGLFSGVSSAMTEHENELRKAAFAPAAPKEEE